MVGNHTWRAGKCGDKFVGEARRSAQDAARVREDDGRDVDGVVKVNMHSGFFSLMPHKDDASILEHVTARGDLRSANFHTFELPCTTVSRNSRRVVLSWAFANVCCFLHWDSC